MKIWITKLLFFFDFRAKQLFKIQTLGVRALVENDLREILLVRHHYWPGWHFPGGRVGSFEEVRETVKREVKEETGVTISDPELSGIYSNFNNHRNDHVIFFRAKQVGGSLAPCNVEIAEARFFSPNDLPPDTAKSVYKRLANEEGSW